MDTAGQTGAEGTNDTGGKLPGAPPAPPRAMYLCEPG